MKVSMNWLKELVEYKGDGEKLGDLFSLMSQEVAFVEKLVDVKKIVIGHVLEKEKHPDAKKLNICKVDVGNEILQIVCGASNVDKGQKVVVSLIGAVLPGDFEIKKSTLRGVESNGMICSLAELGIENKYCDTDGIYVLDKDAPIGEDAVKYLMLDDEIIELDLTPNRGDLLSMIGVAYDTKALTKAKLTIKEPIVKEDTELNNVEIEIDTKKCKSYYARVIKDVKITESPIFIKARLIAAGVRPINNVVDITNYVMLETGQPLHAFDYDSFNSNTILVRNAKKNEVLVTLDNQERKLLDSDIVITNGEKSQCLAGVMGGLESEVTDKTVSILLEAATFDGYSIRKTSNRLNLRSESSMRFERGVDVNRTIIALNKAASLFALYADARILKGVSTFENNNLKAKQIKIDLETINSCLGYKYSVKDIEDVFNRLSFEIKTTGKKFVVSVPSRRPDISTYQDLIEEIVRINGYDTIPLTLPVTVKSGALTDMQLFKRKIKNSLVGSGLNETISYVLIKEDEVDYFTKSKNIVKLAHPMSADRVVCRQSNLNGMLEVIKYNNSRKNFDCNIFELGKVYKMKSENEIVSGMMSGMYESTLWAGKKEVIDFYVLKGIVEKLLADLAIYDVTFTKKEKPMISMHPGQCADIYSGDEYLGFISKLHPTFAKQHSLKDTYVFELDLNTLKSVSSPIVRVKEITKFPSMTRDLAIVFDKDIEVCNITSTIKKYAGKLLNDIQIFDLYTGDKIDESKKCVAVKLEFIDKEKTLETKQVTKTIGSILNRLEHIHKAVLRD